MSAVNTDCTPLDGDVPPLHGLEKRLPRSEVEAATEVPPLRDLPPGCRTSCMADRAWE